MKRKPRVAQEKIPRRERWGKDTRRTYEYTRGKIPLISVILFTQGIYLSPPPHIRRNNNKKNSAYVFLPESLNTTPEREGGGEGPPGHHTNHYSIKKSQKAKSRSRQAVFTIPFLLFHLFLLGCLWHHIAMCYVTVCRLGFLLTRTQESSSSPAVTDRVGVGICANRSLPLLPSHLKEEAHHARMDLYHPYRVSRRSPSTGLGPNGAYKGSA